MLAEIRAAGGVILSDLVTQEDRARLGNNALLTVRCNRLSTSTEIADS